MTNEEAIEALQRIRPAQAYSDSPVYLKHKEALDFAVAALREVEQSRAAVEAWKTLEAMFEKTDNIFKLDLSIVEIRKVRSSAESQRFELEYPNDTLRSRRVGYDLMSAILAAKAQGA